MSNISYEFQGKMVKLGDIVKLGGHKVKIRYIVQIIRSSYPEKGWCHERIGQVYLCGREVKTPDTHIVIVPRKEDAEKMHLYCERRTLKKKDVKVLDVLK